MVTLTLSEMLPAGTYEVTRQGDAPPVSTPTTPTIPAQPGGDYPSGERLKWILASLWWANDSKPQIKLDAFALCYCPTDAPCGEWNRLLNATSGSNPLTIAANWLHYGKSQEATLAFLLSSNLGPVTAQDVADVATVMEHYGLL